MEIKEFAPVIIPTLSRVEHFIRCVESLKKCTYSTLTDLIIGLDYPPSETYREGWLAIKKYLSELEGFNKIVILEANKNLGASANFERLKKYVKEKGYSSYIFTEDDNEFSTNFLAFMNKGLVKFKNNPNVIAICGYLYPVNIEEYNRNIFAYHEWSAWGVGCWINKSPVFPSNYPKMILSDIGNVWKIFRIEPRLIFELFNMDKRGYIYGDVCTACYSILNGSYSIFPSLSKVRNWGNDGSGLHCINDGKSPMDFAIDTDVNFEYDDIELNEINSSSLHNYFAISWKLKVILIIYLLRYYFFKGKY